MTEKEIVLETIRALPDDGSLEEIAEGIEFMAAVGFASKSPKSFLDRVSTGSDSDLVKSWKSRIVRKYCMLITDQVAIAPCTDPVQVRFLLLRQSHCGTERP